MKIVFVRAEDYWIFPLSFLGVVCTGFMLYVGTLQMRLLTGLLGLGILGFGTYVIRKNYSQLLAVRYAAICLASALALAGIMYTLTN